MVESPWVSRKPRIHYAYKNFKNADGKERLAWLQELERVFPDTDSHQRIAGPFTLSHSMFVEKFNVMRTYRFHVAYDRRGADDWVTEKVYQSFLTGTIPIYRGPSNWKQYMPCKNASCVIDADAFSSMEALADHIRYLNNNHTAALAYFDWLNDPDVDVLQALINDSIDNWHCLMAKLIWPSLKDEDIDWYECRRQVARLLGSCSES